MDPAILRLLDGFGRFRGRYFEDEPALFRRLAGKGQKPQVMVIACSDSRVEPALLFGTRPGDLFVVRNVAALVAPYAPDGRAHATAAALEFAVKVLGVRHLVVLGHALCGGVAAAREGVPAGCDDFLAPWTDLLASAVAGAQSAAEAERRAIARSLQNLAGYPWIAERGLALHGWRFDLEAGIIEAWRDGAFHRLAP